MAEKKEFNGYGILFLVMIIFIVASLFALKGNSLDEHSAFEDANEFFSIFSYLMNGDVDSFLDAIPQAMSFLGLFMIMLTLLYYLFTGPLNNIFKQKNVAIAMSFVLTAYCFINNTIYNYMLSLGAIGVGALVFFMLIMMLWTGTKDMYPISKI